MLSFIFFCTSFPRRGDFKAWKQENATEDSEHTEVFPSDFVPEIGYVGVLQTRRNYVIFSFLGTEILPFVQGSERFRAIV